MKLGRIITHGRGKIRRYLNLRFRQNYVAKKRDERQGECNQCGNCCEILFRCPFLVRDGEATLCGIYEDRPGQCAAFPIDEKCLADVDFDCTYTFGPEEANGPLLEIDAPGTEHAAEPVPGPPAPVLAPGSSGVEVEHPEPEIAVERFNSTRTIPIVILAWLIARMR